jgi:ankyrin repeat protein
MSETGAGRANHINDTLIAAVLAGDRPRLEKLLSADASLANRADSGGLTILMIAAMAARADIVDFLLNHRAAIDKTDSSGASALLYSIMHSNVQAAAALIKRGANIYQKDKSGLDAAELAALYSQKEIIELITNKASSRGYNVLKPEGGKYIYTSEDRKNSGVLSAVFSLVITILKYGFVMLLFLIALGIYISKQQEEQITPYPSKQQAQKKSEPVKKVSGAPAQKRTAKKGRSAPDSMLFNLINNSNPKGAAELIAAGMFNLDAADSSRRTPLMLSAKNGYTDLVTLLIEKGAVIEMTDNNGNTALFYAIESGFTGIVKILLEKGADFEHANLDGIKPIILAAKKGGTDIIGLLADKGAGVNAETPYRDTALTWAAYNGHLDAVKFLISRGADTSVTTLHGDTAASLARKQGHHGVADVIDRGNVR